MDPNTPVLVGVAAVQQKLPDYEQALEPLETAAALDPGNSSILRELSTVQWKTGQTNGALDSLRAVSGGEPDLSWRTARLMLKASPPTSSAAAASNCPHSAAS